MTPDRLVFDFDPPDDGDGHLEAIRAGALAVGDLLREQGLPPYAMTSGSRGIHVVAPLRRRAGRRTRCARVAGELAEEVAERLPDQLTTSWRKAGRGGRVLVDAARNTYAQTAVAPYAVRAQAGRAGGDAAVLGGAGGARAAPAAVDAGRACRSALEARGDPWEGIGAAARWSLPGG